LLAAVVLAAVTATCGKQGNEKTEVPAARATKPAPAKANVRYAFGEWSDWQLDCSRRTSDLDKPCAAVRKRICLIEDTKEGVACDHCGGQCREEVADRSPPLYIYTAWSEWNDHCDPCSAQSRPCKADRTRICVDRPSGLKTDCEFCGGACKEEQDRVSGCSPECKWTRVHAYSDDACKREIRDDIFSGQWGPQTNSPFNAGCSQSQWSDKCVKFGRAYYKWEPCTPGCEAPMKH
jgi:hypothetical protein